MKMKQLFAAALLFCTTGAWAQNVGDEIIVDGINYEVKGANVITNGSFDDGVDGWFAAKWENAAAENYTLATEGGFDNGAYLQYSAGGVGAVTNIRGKWAVESGKTYLFRCYTSGKAPASNNLQYSFLKYYSETADNNEGALIYQLVWGAEDVWTENAKVFTATSDMVVFRSSWTENSKLDGFFLGEVERGYTKEQYETTLNAAQAALANEEYANIKGSEKVALENAVTTYASSTAYKEATLALESATATFIAAKASYDALENAKVAAAAYTTEAWPYADPAKKTAIDEAIAVTATTAEDAATKALAIVTAYRLFVESNAKAEKLNTAIDVTALLKGTDASVSTDGWTGSIGTNQGQSYTDGEGKTTSKYFDGGWASNAGANIELTQDVTLPAGQYLITITARGAVSLDEYTFSVGDQSVDLPKDGADLAVGTFGRGWSDKYIAFESTGEALTIKIVAKSEASQQWISFNRIRLTKLDATFADATDYTNLKNAIEAAEAKTIGFEIGEYAPYKNIEACKALAAAKAIDTTVDNEKNLVQDAITALNSATWTANSEFMNPIFDGQFATTEANATSGDINLPGWTKVQGIRLLVKDEATDPGLAYTDGKAALFSWGGTTLTYGEQEGYTLPLNKHEMYELTLKVTGWRDGDKPSYMSAELDGNKSEIDPKVTEKINQEEGNPFVEVKFFLQPTADNSILKIYANKHFVIADLKMVKAEKTNVTMAITAAKYATFIAPFDVTIPTGVTASKVTDLEEDGTTLKLEALETTIPANTPVVLYSETTVNEVLNGPNTAISLTYTSGLLTGTYADAEAPVGSYVLQNLTAGVGFYKVADGKQPTVEANHAWLTVPEATVKAFVLGATTGVQSVKNAEQQNAAIFNLAGQRVGKAQKGIFIQNGKKVVIK